MALRIGVIAEDQSDVDVLYEFTCKLTSENIFSFSKFISHGCGALRRKCGSWSRVLLTRGCSHLVIIHDLDDGDESALRSNIESSLSGITFAGHIILIPIYEIEAWLLCDPLALKDTFSMNKIPKVPEHPEVMRKPKEHLRDIVWKYCKKHYVNTIHNKRIAEATDIARLSVCRSFSPYPEFMASILSS